MNLTTVGSLFSLLVFVHFFSDWTFQSHAEAMAKAKDRVIRAKHCLKYAIPFMLFLTCIGGDGVKFAASTLILIISHFIIDSYVPVIIWAKYFRKAPPFMNIFYSKMNEHGDECIAWRTDEECLKQFAETPIGLILIITMDQLFHIAFLLPVAVMYS